MLDFQVGMWKALGTVDHDFGLKGLDFHFAQVLWCHIQEESLQYAHD